MRAFGGNARARRGLSGAEGRNSSSSCARYAPGECLECDNPGAHVNFEGRVITDCGADRRLKEAEGWFDVSTLKEPYALRQEDPGYELPEQMGLATSRRNHLSNGAGTGLIGRGKR